MRKLREKSFILYLNENVMKFTIGSKNVPLKGDIIPNDKSKSGSKIDE